MTAIEAMSVARAAGVEITLNGDDLVLDAAQEPAADVLSALRRHKSDIVTLLRSAQDSWSAADWQAFFDERAGVAEFDGGLSRYDAEERAFESCVVEWLSRNFRPSDPVTCAACGMPDRDETVIVPVGIDGSDHTWLHAGCWRDWHANRRVDAIAALAIHDIYQPAKLPKDFGKKGRQ